MYYIVAWSLFGAVIGSFGTAFIHEQTGRDVRMGGIIGAVVGAIGSLFFLMLFWLWLYYDRSMLVGRRYGPKRAVWYRWWE